VPSKYYEIDNATGLVKRAAAQAAVTSTGWVGTQWDQGAAVLTDVACIINLEAVNVAADSIYTFSLVGSNVSDRSDGQVLARAVVGNATTVGAPETVAAAAGNEIVLLGRTEKNDTAFRYIDLHLTVAGGSATITFNARIARVK